MIESWFGPAERMAHRVEIGDASTIGLLSIDGNAGVSTVAWTLCHALSGGKTEVLFVDLTSPLQDAAAIADVSSEGMFIQQRLKEGEGGYPRIVARHTTETRFFFNDITLLRQVWKDELRSYSKLVLDLPPVLHERNDLLSPLASAASCDVVFLVCLQGRTARSRLAEAVALLRASRVNLAGVVMNGRDYYSPAEEIARTIRRLFGVGIASRIEKRLLDSRLMS